MAARTDAGTQARSALTKERVLRAAVDVADRDGVDALSMRRVAADLGVVPMALYRHVANKDEMLDGMLDLVIGEIDPPRTDGGWKTAVRERILSARRALLRHPWASRVIESRSEPSPVMLAYMDSMIGLFRAGGFSLDLTHHAMHAMGSRILGFAQELYDDTADPEPGTEAEMWAAMADVYPNIVALVQTVYHDDSTVVGGRGCDDQLEFEFALDLLLDGLDRLRERAG
jgi:AcrR family transcriptional regulator